MTRYVKLEDNSISYAPSVYSASGVTICNFNKSPEIMAEHGYKPLVVAEREAGVDYEVSYEEKADGIYEVLTKIEKEVNEAEERARKDRMSLTPSDVERALYYGLGMDFEDLKAEVAKGAPMADLKALAIEFRASSFYRGAVDRQGNRLVDMMGAVLGLTPDDLDYLFEHKELSREAIDRYNAAHPATPEEPPVASDVETPVASDVETPVEIEGEGEPKEPSEELVEEPSVEEPTAEEIPEETPEEE